MLDDHLLLCSEILDEINSYMREDDMVLYYKTVGKKRKVDSVRIEPQCKISHNEMQ